MYLAHAHRVLAQPIAVITPKTLLMISLTAVNAIIHAVTAKYVLKASAVQSQAQPIAMANPSILPVISITVVNAEGIATMVKPV